jgi:hypothetical protein
MPGFCFGLKKLRYRMGMKKVYGVMVVVASLLLAGVAQADVIGQQTDQSTQVIFLNASANSFGYPTNVFQLPALTGTLKAFDVYLSMSGYNYPNIRYQGLPTSVAVVFSGSGCPTASGVYSASNTGIPTNNSDVETGLINPPALVHLTLDSGNWPMYSGQTGCTVQLIEDQSVSANMLSTQVATGTVDQIYFVGYNNFGPIPHIISASIRSSNASTTLAKAGDTITLTFSADEAVQTPLVTIAGHPASVATTTGNSFEASTTLTAADPNGPVVFSIAATSTLGDDSAPVSTTSDGTAVYADLTAPTLTADSRITNEQTPLIGGSAIDTGSGVAGVSAVVNGVTYTASTTASAWSVLLPALPEGLYAVAVSAVDNAGNSATSSAILTIDRTAPVVTITSGPANGSLTNVTSATFTFTSDAPTACALDGGTYTACSGSFATSSLSAGTHLFAVSASDDAGNTTTVTRSWSVDNAAPILKEVAIATTTTDTTPTYVFSSSKAGSIAYGGACSSVTTLATVGDNTISFNQLLPGTYSNCTLQVTDSAGNISNLLQVSTFTILAFAPPPPPSGDKDQCKKNGWRTFVNPTFKNQGDCVSYFVSHKYNGNHDDRYGDQDDNDH